MPSVDTTQFARRPRISIVMPVYNVEPRWLRHAVASVFRQTYPDWELCIVDDASTDPATRRAIRRLEKRCDPSRMRIVWRSANGGIATATNDGIDAATGDFIGFLDNDDELHPQALAYVVEVINEDALVDVIYTDQDKIDARGRHFQQFYKPDWSPWYFRGAMYVGHFLVVKSDLARLTGPWDSSLDYVADFDFMLRASEHAVRIRHIPRILYSWRALQSSGASHSDAKPGTGVQQCRAVNAHLQRMNLALRAEPHPTLPHRVVLRPVPMEHAPKVTVIIPTKDKPELIGRCLSTLFEKSSYPRWDVVVVDTGSTEARAVEILGRWERDKPTQFKRILLPGPFNYSRANNVAVAQSDGEMLLFLNNDTEIIQPDWMEQMVMLASVENVGAVGAQLIYPNGTVQHAGVALGLRGTADHVMRGLPADGDGYAGSMCCVREVAAVTAACMMVRRNAFLRAGGFDEYYGTHYQDVDLCLALVRQGYSNLYAAGSRVVHHESASRGSTYDVLDRQALIDRWQDELSGRDRFHNPVVPCYRA